MSLNAQADVTASMRGPLLVAVDDSAPSQFAIGEGLKIAERDGRRIIFAVVLDPDILVQNYGWSSTQELAESLASDILHSAMDDAKAASVTAASKILFRDAPQGIIDMADSENAAMIVVGTHGRSGLARELVRSVADAVLERTDRPVCVMRNRPAQSTYNRFLVPIADNELEQAAARYSVHLAREFASTLLFCTVRSAQNDQALLDRTKRCVLERGVEADTLLLEGPDVSESILRSAQLNQIDGIVMATHGREGFMRMVKGSVTESVVRSSLNPVVVIRPHRLLG